MAISSIKRARDAPPATASKRQMDVFFFPKSVAVIGATDRVGHVGWSLLCNLTSKPSVRRIYPVNPRKAAILGIPAWPTVGAIPEAVDLAVIATPAATVPEVVRQCAEAGVGGAVILAAGFRETGFQGMQLEQEAVANARKAGMRLIGPNSLGVMCTASGLNATVAPAIALPGSVALISQSGTMCAAILDWSRREHVGLSAVVSVGSMADVGWGNLIDYLGDDPRTQSIVIYMESVGDARSFLSAAREVALSKPIIVIKSGRTEQASYAAAAHTGSLTGSDEVLDAAFRRVGVLRVKRMSDVFSMTEVLAEQPRPRGPRLAIVTNAGGPGVIATDALLESGGILATLSTQTIAALDRVLPPHWSRRNPVDIIGDAGPERFEKAVEIVAADPGSDGILVIMTPQGMTNPQVVAEKLRRFARLPGKPILASWMGGVEASRGEAVLAEVGIPTFAFPDTAVRAFQYMWRYSYNLRALYETPTLARPDDRVRSREAQDIIDNARASRRTILGESDSRRLLSSYDIPVLGARLATTEDEAVAVAAEIGYPVVVKLNSPRILHKTDVGGVALHLWDDNAVRRAWRTIEASVTERAGSRYFCGVNVQSMITTPGYELILGSTIDPQFGPVLLFGGGGELAAVLRDTAIALPPLNSTLALRFMEQTRIVTALQGVRGRKPVDMLALAQLLVQFSHLVSEQRSIREIDLNPLFASSEQLIVLDAKVVLHEPDTSEAELPSCAIRPYPSQYITTDVLADGTRLSIRPIRPEDEPMLVSFHNTLSERSVYLRYFNAQNVNQRTAHERLIRSCFIDYDRQMALVAERDGADNGTPQIVGVGRLVRSHVGNDAEMAVIVTDAFQHRGIGHALARQLIAFAKDETMDRITAVVLLENRAMRTILEKLGFVFANSCDGEILEAELRL